MDMFLDKTIKTWGMIWGAARKGAFWYLALLGPSWTLGLGGPTWAIKESGRMNAAARLSRKKIPRVQREKTPAREGREPWGPEKAGGVFGGPE
jgi:hypothetical protein